MSNEIVYDMTVGDTYPPDMFRVPAGETEYCILVGNGNPFESGISVDEKWERILAPKKLARFLKQPNGHWLFASMEPERE